MNHQAWQLEAHYGFDDLTDTPTLRHQDWDIIDGTILSCATGQWRGIGLVLQLIMQCLPTKYPHLSERFYLERIRELVRQGVLDMQGGLGSPRCEVRIPPPPEFAESGVISSFHPRVVRSRADWGLPEERLQDRHLQYNARASTLVLSFTVSRLGVTYSRTYVRRIWEDRYRPALDLKDDDYSLEGPVVAEEPIAFFVLSRWPRSETAGSYVGLVRLNLETNDAEIWNTDVEGAGAQRFFVSDLASADRSGRLLYATVGLRPLNGGGFVEYALAAIDWKLKAVGKLSRLDAVFF